MEKSEYQEIMVVKPWGKEHIFYSQNDIAIWKLHINKGHSTSLHSHPKKKTVIIVIKGEVTTSFLTGGFEVLHEGQKITIREGVFHRTEAVKDSILLEIESPNIKTDLIRIKDKYGRQGTSYEGPENYKNDDPDYLYLTNQVAINNFNIAIKNATKELLTYPESISIILTNGIQTYNKDIVATVGDSLNPKAASILLTDFILHPDTKIVHIWK